VSTEGLLLFFTQVLTPLLPRPVVFLNVGGGLLLGAAQSGFVNTVVRTLPSTAPGVDPFTVISTGALEIRSVFPADQVLGVLQAYAAGIKVAFAIALAACGTSLIISFLGGWRRLSTGGQSLGAMA
jgi:MFS transporter, DHA2 family, glioxin efflux transporter